MKTRLHINNSYHVSLDSWKGKEIQVRDKAADIRKMPIGMHKAGIVWETETSIKVRIGSDEFWLPKCAFRTVVVEKKGLFDF